MMDDSVHLTHGSNPVLFTLTETPKTTKIVRWGNKSLTQIFVRSWIRSLGQKIAMPIKKGRPITQTALFINSKIALSG
jgi:hypothetical protein